MTETCNNCGFVNDAALASSTNCPQCGSPYMQQRAATAPTPPLPFTPTVAPPVAEQSDRTRTRLFIALGVVVALIALAVGGFSIIASSRSHAAATVATATPTTVPVAAKVTYQQYSDPDGHFVLEYPSTWQALSAPATLSGVSTNLTTFTAMKVNGKAAGNAGFAVASGDATLTFALVSDILKQNGLSNYTPVGNPTVVTTKRGQAWQTLGGTATTAKGKNVTVTSSLTQHGTVTYLVVGAYTGKAEDKLYMYMLNSIKFAA